MSDLFFGKISITVSPIFSRFWIRKNSESVVVIYFATRCLPVSFCGYCRFVDNTACYPHRLDNSFGVAHSLHKTTTNIFFNKKTCHNKFRSWNFGTKPIVRFWWPLNGHTALGQASAARNAAQTPIFTCSCHIQIPGQILCEIRIDPFIFNSISILASGWLSYKFRI